MRAASNKFLFLFTAWCSNVRYTDSQLSSGRVYRSSLISNPEYWNVGYKVKSVSG